MMNAPDEVQAILRTHCGRGPLPGGISERLNDRQVEAIAKEALGAFTEAEKGGEEAEVGSVAAAEATLLGLSELSGCDSVIMKNVYNALACTFVAAVKEGVTPEKLHSFLANDVGLEDGTCSIISRAFRERSARLQHHLEQVANHTHLAELTGASWRLDHCLGISSNGREGAIEPLYHIALHTSSGSSRSSESQREATREARKGVSDGDVRFSCDLNELQDMVNHFREACNSVEQAAGC
eukprot:TRINITY_DN3778_c1_g1_i1.p1 TRINITY_DN3778_c1_g1~~TRINITY_DN3778_c1_g1_i1.p1  ORF type:complete len:239 (-),score=26.75 TRINITY_DN3778_c1_g1_i1:205-921(-)